MQYNNYRTLVAYMAHSQSLQALVTVLNQASHLHKCQMILNQWQGIKTKHVAFNTKIIQRKVLTFLILETMQTGPILGFLFGIESG